MADYLQGYLTVLPSYEKAQVEKFLTDNEDIYEIQAINEDQFQQLINVLQEGIKKVTKLVQQGDKLDAESFNQFYSAVDVDLQRLYAQHLRTEVVVANYDRILKGLLEDMYRELQKLRQKVDELDMRAKGEEGLLVIGYGFEEETASEHRETNRSEYIGLFKDRDGSILPDAALVRDYHQQYLMLPYTAKVNCLRNDKNQVTASIEIVERRGNAVADPAHPLNLAIDTGENTYWAESVVMDAIINNARMYKIKKEDK